MAEEKKQVPQKDFDTRRKESIEFLLGKSLATDWHAGPMFEETKVISGSLVKINQMGLLTLSSQPGLFETAEADQGEEAKEMRIAWAKQHERYLLESIEKSESAEIRQRAFVECICLQADSEHVVAGLVARGLWVNCDGKKYHDSRDPVALTTTNVITKDGYEAIVVDTKAYSVDSGQITQPLFGENSKYDGMVIIDPLFRRNTLFVVVVDVLAQLRSEKKINAVSLE